VSRVRGYVPVPGDPGGAPGRWRRRSPSGCREAVRGLL